VRHLLSPLRGFRHTSPPYLGLTPEATCCRHFVAEIGTKTLVVKTSKSLCQPQSFNSPALVRLFSSIKQEPGLTPCGLLARPNIDISRNVAMSSEVVSNISGCLPMAESVAHNPSHVGRHPLSSGVGSRESATSTSRAEATLSLLLVEFYPRRGIRAQEDDSQDPLDWCNDLAKLRVGRHQLVFPNE
jgi:hypothetical protein